MLRPAARRKPALGPQGSMGQAGLGILRFTSDSSSLHRKRLPKTNRNEWKRKAMGKETAASRCWTSWSGFMDDLFIKEISAVNMDKAAFQKASRTLSTATSQLIVGSHQISAVFHSFD